MVINFGKSKIFKRQMAQSFHRFVGCEYAAAGLLEKFADGFGVHGRLLD